MLALALAVGGCTLPRSAPTTAEFVGNSADSGLVITPIDAADAQAYRASPGQGFPAAMLEAEPIDLERVSVGDDLRLSIIEGTGLQSSALPGGALTIERLVVDGDGSIFVPFAGSVDAAGRTLDEIRATIAARLRRTLFRPQVDVQFLERAQRTVAIYGDVATGGSLALAPGMRRLSDLLGRAGIQTETSRATQVEVRRDGMVGRVSLARLLADPAEDIALRPGDVVIVSDADQFVTVMGAAGVQSRVPILGDRFSLLDALASSRGLADDQADPEGVFLLRRQPDTPVPGAAELAIYQLDVRNPAQLFAAGEFAMIDGDIVLVSSASFAQTRKILSAISATLTTASRTNQAIP
ncbi:polysaccharide biosynthesis/export family protein [Sphingomicrobium astaxanthinifaciens]|uniref:polysaccharide biosynthesis/export family protein n=1 Tax=Sphingomicrobium astaxanthinifaciens TaxID=1227949 RepID=UPI001FCBD178|nr:polysaccharide biosynthesis/export family protein [Sphingomicrobium astaxanthinifaciens]MCJ7420791.1 polysaccharide biosynthesis/export family protein [Sphingomicrobium astaxanthinifaciens]